MDIYILARYLGDEYIYLELIVLNYLQTEVTCPRYVSTYGYGYGARVRTALQTALVTAFQSALRSRHRRSLSAVAARRLRTSSADGW
jgi:hypothetical protein